MEHALFVILMVSLAANMALVMWNIGLSDSLAAHKRVIGFLGDNLSKLRRRLKKERKRGE